MNIFIQLIKSLYSPKMISRFRFHSMGRAIGYTFLIVFLFSIPQYIMIYVATNVFSNEVTRTLNTIGDLKIVDGELQTSSKDSFVDEKNGSTIAFFPGETDMPKDIAPPKYGVIILKNQFIIYEQGKARNFSYDMLPPTITSQDVKSFFNNSMGFVYLLVTLLIIFIYLLTTFNQFILIAVFGFLGYLFSKVAHRKINGKQMWILTTFALTLPTLFTSILPYFGIDSATLFIIYLVSAILMVSMSVLSLPKPTKQPTS